MIVYFTVKNFKSFKEEVNFSMLASTLKEAYDLPSNAAFEFDNFMKVLPVAGVFGANASGKSNLFDAMTMMKFHIQTSLSKENEVEKVKVEPFRLSTVTENEPTEFEISFIRGDKLFRYGFLATKDRVVEEWLFEKDLKERAKEKEMFYREGGQLAHHPTLFKIGRTIKQFNEIALILTLAYQLRDETAMKVMEWFVDFNTLRGHRDEDFEFFSITQIDERSDIAGDMFDLMRYADTGITELSSAIIMDRPEALAHHPVYDENEKAAGEKWFIMSKQESEGTKKLFSLSGPILNSLKFGKVLVIDELDSKLHPNLLELLVRMFQDKKINKNAAQLIFTAHNTNILNAKLLRRDQVWITEKNRFGATSLYSIADYKTDKGKARNKEAIGQNYIDGKYGGIPFLGDFENFLDQYSDEQGK